MIIFNEKQDIGIIFIFIHFNYWRRESFNEKLMFLQSEVLVTIQLSWAADGYLVKFEAEFDIYSLFIIIANLLPVCVNEISFNSS